MDVESALRNDRSLCPLTYTDLGCSVKSRWLLSRKRKDNDVQIILKDACGAIRPGRLTFILGPSGAGKTTLLKILAGRKKSGVTGSLQGVTRNIVLVPQQVTLIDTLTVKETMQFAASLKLSRASYQEQYNTIERISKQLGINDVLNTRAGRLSGGERKRLTVACELLTDPTIMLLDEPTSGLDSVSSMSVARALKSVAQSGRTVACVIHQPSSQLFTSADDVILMANGRTLYAGAVTDVPEMLRKSGFVCPLYYNMADYHNSTEVESLLHRKVQSDNHYEAGFGQQLRSLLWRGYLGALRDFHLTQIRVLTHFVVALLLGALYQGAGAEASRMISNTGCLFFFLLFLYFSNAMPTIHTFPVESTVVLQEHLNKWYSLSTYCITKIVVDLPIQLLCATIFVLPAWYLTSQPLEPYRLILAWSICTLLTILAQTFGLVVGAACGVKLGLFVIPAANIPMLMFSEFFIPYQEMPSYLQPFALMSYFRYSFDAFMQTAYGFGRKNLPCNKIFCLFKQPDKYLDYLGLQQNFTNDVIALVALIDYDHRNFLDWS
ncbi:unnamed protein product [Danaus chrysippus]|uniref:(African queen) hypothetical protein n=1 Tax=Danaus chrysippus TaxID=151541 RepID=A0A8J2R581_9NEOP|nr:unnamed protein product [Danaus chrysippus]